MNLRRGFRRIAIVLAVVVAVICASLSVSTIYEDRYWAQEKLRWERIHLQREQKRYKEHLEVKQHPQKEEEVAMAMPGMPFRPRRVKTEAELKQLEAKVKELEKGFWVTLSSRAFVGLCILAGLGGVVAGIVGAWLLYLLIKWVVRGFYD